MDMEQNHFLQASVLGRIYLVSLAILRTLLYMTVTRRSVDGKVKADKTLLFVRLCNFVGAVVLGLWLDEGAFRGQARFCSSTCYKSRTRVWDITSLNKMLHVQSGTLRFYQILHVCQADSNKNWVSPLSESTTSRPYSSTSDAQLSCKTQNVGYQNDSHIPLKASFWR